MTLLNFWLSFLVRPLHVWKDGTAPQRIPSGIPFMGSALVILGVWLNPAFATYLVGAALLLADTGGPLWFLAQAFRQKARS